METLASTVRETVVVTTVRCEVSKALTPIMRDRYPTLPRFIGVDTGADRIRFEAAGMRPVVHRSVPQGTGLAAAVLRAQRADEAKIQA